MWYCVSLLPLPFTLMFFFFALCRVNCSECMECWLLYLLPMMLVLFSCVFFYCILMSVMLGNCDFFSRCLWHSYCWFRCFYIFRSIFFLQIFLVFGWCHDKCFYNIENWRYAQMNENYPEIVFCILIFALNCHRWCLLDMSLRLNDFILLDFLLLYF